MVYLGLRASEVAHLKLDWISRGEITIPEKQPCTCRECVKRYQDGHWHGKTKASARTIPIPDALVKDLREALTKSPKGFKLTRFGIWAKVKRLSAEAAIYMKGTSAGNTTFAHALRATAATRFAVNGMDAAALCYVMGWANINVATRYIQLAQAKSLARQQVRQILR